MIKQARLQKIKSLKIAIITGLFPLTSETFVVDHIAWLIEHGHQVDVFAFGPPNGPAQIHQEVEKFGLMDKVRIFPFYHLPKQSKAKWEEFTHLIKKLAWRHPIWMMRCLSLRNVSMGYVFYVTAMAEPLMHKRYDVIHCHFGTNAHNISFVKKIFKHSKYFVTFHGHDVRKGLDNQIDYRDLFKDVDGVISICDFNREKLMYLGCPKEKLVYLPNGVNVDHFRRNGSEGKKERPVILTVARLHKIKNIPFALNIIREVVKKIPDVEYWIIGDGKMREELEARIIRLKLENNVKLFGGMKHHEVRDKFNQCDILLLTSSNEALPVTLLEAQAMEVPVVATNVGGVSEAMQDGVTGALIELNDVEHAAETIVELLEQPDKRMKMGRAGRSFIENKFNMRKIIQEMERLYHR